MYYNLLLVFFNWNQNISFLFDIRSSFGFYMKMTKKEHVFIEFWMKR